MHLGYSCAGWPAQLEHADVGVLWWCLGGLVVLAAALLAVMLRNRRLARLVAASDRALQVEATARARAESAAKQSETQRGAAADAQRMATLGALVSSLAHEVNNPNHTIMLNVPVLRAAWQDALAILDQHARTNGTFRLANIPYTDMRDDVLRLIDEILAGADRIRSIVSGLRTYVRGHAPHDLRPVGLGPILADAVAAARPSVEAATDVFTVDIDGDLPSIRGDRLLLTQAFVSLLVRASQTLAARTQCIELRASARGQEVFVDVRDEGCGVPEHEIAHLQRPFHQSGGNLDLAVAAWIVQQHGGRLAVTSCPEAGTSARVTLPTLGGPVVSV